MALTESKYSNRWEVMKLDNFEPASLEMMRAMFDLADLKAGEKHIELGSGDGRFVVEALKRGAKSVGYEIDRKLARNSIREHGINVVNENCFEADVSQADVITCWFTLLPETRLLMDKLHKEMKKGARLVKGGYTYHNWKPEPVGTHPQKEIYQSENILRVDDEIICLYLKK